MKKQGWSVRLGEIEWSRFTYARAQDDSLRLLGSVRRGMQMGALAITADGTYVQVVGDQTSRLNTGQISRAIDKARGLQPKEPYLVQRTVPRAAPTTVIIVKRRRIPVAA